MKSIINYSNKETYDDDDDSTIELELKEYYSRKRCVSIENQIPINENENFNKKQRNNNDYLKFFDNIPKQQIISSPKSDESFCIQQQNSRIIS